MNTNARNAISHLEGWHNMENLLDRKIEKMALDFFYSQGMSQSEVNYSFEQLRSSIDRGFYSRALMIGLLKFARGQR
jgi:hypothetical protein